VEGAATMSDPEDTKDGGLPKNFMSAREIIDAYRKGLLTDGDLAVVLLAMPFGVAADILLHLTGVVSLGWCSIMSASLALGGKRGIQGFLKASQVRDQQKRAIDDTRRSLEYNQFKALERASAVEALILAFPRSDALAEELQTLQAEMAIAANPALYDEKALHHVSDQALKAYREKRGN
jgi:hypothetical protein